MKFVLQLALALAVLPACNDVAGTAGSPELTGRYVLMGDEGHPLPFDSPIGERGGEITLTVDGVAVWRLFYTSPPSEQRIEQVLVGTYRFDRGLIELQFPGQAGRDSSWSPNATFDSGVITLTYTDTADSSEMVEEYVDVDHILY